MNYRLKNLGVQGIYGMIKGILTRLMDHSLARMAWVLGKKNKTKHSSWGEREMGRDYEEISMSVLRFGKKNILTPEETFYNLSSVIVYVRILKLPL